VPVALWVVGVPGCQDVACVKVAELRIEYTLLVWAFRVNWFVDVMLPRLFSVDDALLLGFSGFSF
jgi:hypothetical protein